MNTLLLIDDDKELNHLLCEYLTTEGFEVTPAYDGESALKLATEGNFSALVLDVMLPIRNGFEVLKTLRKTHQTPVLMLTAKGETVDRVVGLEIGADDYLTKPCDPRELAARLRAILRRSQSNDIAQPKLEKIVSGSLVLHLGNRNVTWAGSEIILTGTEFSVLAILVRHAGQVINKDEMTEQALSRKLTPYDRSIDVHVSNIRKKLTQAGAQKELIINVRGAGYMLTLQNDR
jgi:two-component system, OmpR family, response regulator